MKKYLTEFIGTLFLTLVFVLTKNNGTGDMAPLAIGATLMALVYAGGHLSGGHYNPVITLAMLMRGKVERGDAIYYIVAQMAGALIAAFLSAFLLHCQGNVDIRPIQHIVLCSLLAEVLGTFALAYVVLNVMTTRSNSGHSHDGLAIGFALTAMMYTFGSITGGVFNPALALGISLTGMSLWSDVWIYFFGALLGAAAATTMFQVLYGSGD